MLLRKEINLTNTRVNPTAAKRAWADVGSNTECDASAGEVYRSQSSSKVSDLAACKKSCEDDAGCQSITFFDSGWCSHFNTGCTKTKSTSKAISMRLGGTQLTTAASTSGGTLLLFVTAFGDNILN